MDNLYLETKNGTVPIDKNIQKKYNLKKGTKSPFTNERILGENGDFTEDMPKDKDSKSVEHVKKEDNTVELEHGVMFTTSEVLDISRGADSTEQNRQ